MDPPFSLEYPSIPLLEYLLHAEISEGPCERLHHDGPAYFPPHRISSAHFEAYLLSPFFYRRIYAALGIRPIALHQTEVQRNMDQDLFQLFPSQYTPASIHSTASLSDQAILFDIVNKSHPSIPQNEMDSLQIALLKERRTKYVHHAATDNQKHIRLRFHVELKEGDDRYTQFLESVGSIMFDMLYGDLSESVEEEDGPLDIETYTAPIAWSIASLRSQHLKRLSQLPCGFILMDEIDLILPSLMPVQKRLNVNVRYSYALYSSPDGGYSHVYKKGEASVLQWLANLLILSLLPPSSLPVLQASWPLPSGILKSGKYRSGDIVCVDLASLKISPDIQAICEGYTWPCVLISRMMAEHETWLVELVEFPVIFLPNSYADAKPICSASIVDFLNVTPDYVNKPVRQDAVSQLLYKTYLKACAIFRLLRSTFVVSTDRVRCGLQIHKCGELMSWNTNQSFIEQEDSDEDSSASTKCFGILIGFTVKRSKLIYTLTDFNRECSMDASCVERYGMPRRVRPLQRETNIDGFKYTLFCRQPPSLALRLKKAREEFASDLELYRIMTVENAPILLPNDKENDQKFEDHKNRSKSGANNVPVKRKPAMSEVQKLKEAVSVFKLKTSKKDKFKENRKKHRRR